LVRNIRGRDVRARTLTVAARISPTTRRPLIMATARVATEISARETTARRIPAQRYDVPEEDIDQILGELGALLRTRSFLSMGAHCEIFERRFADYVGCAHAVSVNTGTGALEIILRSLDVAGSEVIVPTNTFAATAFAVLHAGATPVFADCADDLVLDPSDVERRLSATTSAVIVVHDWTSSVDAAASCSSRMRHTLTEALSTAAGRGRSARPPPSRSSRPR